MIKTRHLLAAITACGLLVFASPASAQNTVSSYVKPFMGSTAGGHCLPIAATPFGMVELGPDTHRAASGYDYGHDAYFGFSHVHKNGGGCSDLQDIKFMPVNKALWDSAASDYPLVKSRIDHSREIARPGYFRTELPDYGVSAELTATSRCGVHRYTFPEDEGFVSIDLEWGSCTGCTIWPDENYDTVKVATIAKAGRYAIKGERVSNGWCPEQHVSFYVRFNKPIKELRLYDGGKLVEGAKKLVSQDIKALVKFDCSQDHTLEAYVGISPNDPKGARKNYRKELKGNNFDTVCKATEARWEQELSVVSIGDDADLSRKEVFYTSLYYALLYPQLYSDVDGRFRSSDVKVYKSKRPYYAGVLSLWDTFRAQCPLITVLHPEVMSDLMDTFLRHYSHFGQLPIWTLAGQENFCMIGYHSMPVIADVYAKGIRGFDADALFDAMTVSAERDTFGFFVKDYRGSRNYLKYNYVPCDLEITAVSKTLEYCYDDWCIWNMSRLLGRESEGQRFLERSGWWRNVFDSQTRFMRGKDSAGQWRTPFDPHFSNHYHEGDDFCEGTSWQWTFFVPQDIPGLVEAFGGKEQFISKLDSLFTASSELRGDHVAGDITGMIGQYAHGNEPSHHTIYVYDLAGEPWKAQQRLSEVMYKLYDTTPDGMCGNEDTGQMSAWYVFSAMGFYPFTHGDGRYLLGTPLFPSLSLKHSNGTLTVLAPGVSQERCYIQSLKVNGEPWNSVVLTHDLLFGGDTTLEFTMGDTPNPDFASSSK